MNPCVNIQKKKKTAMSKMEEEGEKIWHAFGGCSVPAPKSGSAFLKLLGWE